jgi:hypothetical protein
LPKNPHFADHLLRLALARSYGPAAAALIDRPLDDTLEWQAHKAMLRRLGVQPRGRVMSAGHVSESGIGETAATTSATNQSC